MADGGRPITAADLGALFSDRCLVNADEPRTDAPGDDALLDTTGSDPTRGSTALRGTAVASRTPGAPRTTPTSAAAARSPRSTSSSSPPRSAGTPDATRTPRASRAAEACSSQGTSQAVPSLPAALDVDFDQLQTIAARMMLRLGPDPNDPTHAPHAANMAAARDVAPRRSTNEWDSFVDFCARVSAEGSPEGGPTRRFPPTTSSRISCTRTERGAGDAGVEPGPGDGGGDVPGVRRRRR